MASLGLLELVIILLIFALVFGVDKLGDVGGAVGRGVRGFKWKLDAAPANETPLPEETPDHEALPASKGVLTINAGGVTHWTLAAYP